MTCAANDGRPRAGGLRLCRECVGRLSRAANALALNVIPLRALALREWRHPTTGHGGTRAFAPLPVDVTAWDALAEVEDAVRLAAAGCGCPGTFGPSDTAEVLRFMAAWVAGAPEGLARREDAAAWLRTLESLARKADAIVNPRPGGKQLIGACTVCGGAVWAEAGEAIGECKDCGRTQARGEVGDRLLALLSSSEVVGTAAELSRECARAGVRLPAATIRKWVERGKIRKTPDGHIALSSLVPLLGRAEFGVVKKTTQSQEVTDTRSDCDDIKHTVLEDGAGLAQARD